MENDKIKTSRASQTRDKTSQKKFGLHPHHLMHPLRQTGYRHRWIRAEIFGFQ